MTAIDGGGGRAGEAPPGSLFTTRDDLIEEHELFENNNRKRISIAERRAAKCGFNPSNINVARFRITTTDSTPQVRLGLGSPCFTIPPGISPSALLDSPIMLPNAQAQHSPTTGTIGLPSPNHHIRGLNLNLKLQHEPEAQAHETRPLEGLEYLHEMSKKDSCFGVDALAKSNQILSSHSEQIRGTERYSNHHKSKEVGYKYSDDGFHWRKYGQKHVKGSEFPRSYYKCTATNCPVKKIVKRSCDGRITEIVYKGSHNHPLPDQGFKRFGEQDLEMSEGSPCFQTDGKDSASSSDWRPDHCGDGTIPTSFPSDFSDHPISKLTNGIEPVETQFSSTLGPESISLNDEDDETGESREPRKRTRESFPIETTASRSTREPRVVVQIQSEIDILDDGYRWRKYGQKVVKGNPNPRSYYKCTTPGCPVRKHVERAASDIKSVVTTYEGKHSHQVPTNKNSNLVTCDVASLRIPPTALSTPSTMAQKLRVQRQGKQVQDLPFYLDRNPIFRYDELMMSSNLPGNFGNDTNSSSVYPLSLPPFQSSSPYGSLLTDNSRHVNNYASSYIYPMLPDYMPLSSRINHVSPLHFNTYSSIPTGREMEIREQHTKTVKPKEEWRFDGDELY